MTGWRSTNLGAIATLQRGFDLPSRLRQRGTVPIVSSSGVSGWHSHAMVKAPGVVTGRYGTIGEVFYEEVDFWPLNTTLWVSNFHGNDERFIYYLLQRVNFTAHSGKSGVPGVNRNDLHTEIVSVPTSASEQRAIARVLSDCDDLIATLARAIAKKQAIKVGMLQQLLAGTTRLPGYTQHWQEVRLRDAGFTYGGLTGKSKDDFGTGSASYVTFMEVMAGPRLLGRELGRVRVRPGERQNRVERGDVLFNGSSETPEEVALSALVDFEPNAATFLNSFCFGYRLTRPELIDPAYLAHFFRSGGGRALVASLAQGATRYNIAKTKLLELSPLLPTVDEQRAIVTKLRDCEDEIATARRRLAKVKAIKQGMMQELLTGKTRLPLKEAAS